MTYLEQKAKEQDEKDKELARMVLEENNNKTRLAKRLGVTRPTAYSYIRRPGVQKNIAILLEKCGMTDEFLCLKVREGLAADFPYRKGNKIIREKDFDVRHKYLRTALELKELIKSENTGGNVSNVIINIVKAST